MAKDYKAIDEALVRFPTQFLSQEPIRSFFTTN
jgi:hypothetical protein